MRVSEFFKLGRSQPTLDFVDVDVYSDVPIFIDPRALKLVQSGWAHECISLIKDFFREVLRALRSGDRAHATSLLAQLSEPNETHLGLSKGRSQGHAMAYGKAAKVARALAASEAVKTGLLKDLEETALMIEGIAFDIVSDIATNIIREPLIRYTQYACQTYGIPLTEGVASGPLWDPTAHRWYAEYAKLPVTQYRRLLLVPKVLVRRKLDYNHDEYFNHFIVPFLQAEELAKNSGLVEILKSGPRVTKKAIKESYGTGKNVSLETTLNNPHLLANYRKAKSRISSPPDHDEIAKRTGAPTVKWAVLLNRVKTCKPGNADADKYHKAVEQLLTALFYPALSHPELEDEIHEGRKRIDITYVNSASSGFFWWLSANYAAAHIFVECKNYRKDVKNPELDQLAGRFSPSRGKVGFLVCRSFSNKSKFLKSCRDTSNDDRGYIMALDDNDLEEMVALRKEDSARLFQFLKKKFDQLIM